MPGSRGVVIAISDAFEIVALAVHTLARATHLQVTYADEAQIRLALPNGAHATALARGELVTDVVVVGASADQVTALAGLLRATLDCDVAGPADAAGAAGAAVDDAGAPRAS